MNSHTVMDIGAKTVWVAIQVAAPALLATLITGLVVSVFQAATQINEQTLSFIPKILMMTIALVLCGPWILQTMLDFTIGLFTGIPEITK